MSRANSKSSASATTWGSASVSGKLTFRKMIEFTPRGPPAHPIHNSTWSPPYSMKPARLESCQRDQSLYGGTIIKQQPFLNEPSFHGNYGFPLILTGTIFAPDGTIRRFLTNCSSKRTELNTLQVEFQNTIKKYIHIVK